MRTLLFATFAVLVGVSTGFTGCDPTEQSFAVTLKNDTSQALVAEQCGHGCDATPTERDRLKPGETVEVNTSSEHVANWWRLTTSDGRTAGCVNLSYDRKASNVVVPLSRLKRCPTS